MTEECLARIIAKDQEIEDAIERGDDDWAADALWNDTRNDVPELLAEVNRLRKQNEQLHNLLGKVDALEVETYNQYKHLDNGTYYQGQSDAYNLVSQRLEQILWETPGGQE